MVFGVNLPWCSLSRPLTHTHSGPGDGLDHVLAQGALKHLFVCMCLYICVYVRSYAHPWQFRRCTRISRFQDLEEVIFLVWAGFGVGGRSSLSPSLLARVPVCAGRNTGERALDCGQWTDMTQ